MKKLFLTFLATAMAFTAGAQDRNFHIFICIGVVYFCNIHIT